VVDAVLRAPDPSPAALRDAVEWDRSGWPSFAMYQPIFQVGLSNHLPIVAANLSRPSARAVIHHGPAALAPVIPRLLARAGPLPADEERERREEMAALHCGQLPEPFLGPMVLSQRARDAQLAESLRERATAGGGVLVTGAEHARRDRGAGEFLRVAGVAPGGIVAVAFREVDPAEPAPAGYDPGPWDYVVFTPGAEREDPCREMRPPAGPMPTASAQDRAGVPGGGGPGRERGSWLGSGAVEEDAQALAEDGLARDRGGELGLPRRLDQVPPGAERP
jgi:hypothetical protein